MIGNRDAITKDSNITEKILNPEFILISASFILAMNLGYLASVTPLKAFMILLGIPLMWITLKKPSVALALIVPGLLLIPPWYTLMEFGIPIVQLDFFKVFGLLFFVILFTGFCTRRYNKLQLNRLDIILLILNIYSIISCIGFWDEEIRRLVFSLIFTPMVFYFTVKFIHFDQQNLELLENMMILAGVILSLTMLYESFIVKGPLFVSPDLPQYQWVANDFNVFRAGGMTGGAPRAGLLLSIIVFVAFGKYVEKTGGKRIKYAIAFAIIMTAIFITYTRAIWFGIIGGFFFYFLLTEKKRLTLFIIFLSIIVVIVLIAPINFSDDIMEKGIMRPGTLFSRFTFWKESIEIYTESIRNMLFGIGFFGSRKFEVVGDMLLVEVGTHCYYLTMLLETGLIGLFLYILIGYFSFRIIHGNIRNRGNFSKTSRRYALLFSSLMVVFIANFMGEYPRGKHELILFMIILSLAVNKADIYLEKDELSNNGDNGSENQPF